MIQEAIQMKNLIEGKFLYKQLSQLLIDTQQYLFAIVKGEPLSIEAYQKNGMRLYNDIDILVSRKNLKKLEEVLQANGFMNIYSNYSREDRIFVLTNSHQLLPYTKNINGNSIYIDLSYDIFWGEYEGKRIDIEEFLSDTIEMEIYGVKVKTLPPLKAMIQLILHHYKDMNSLFLLATRKSIKYDMFKDVYYLLKNNLDAIPLDKLYAMSAEYEIIPYVFYVLYYTGQVFDDDVLKQYIEAFRTPEGESLLNCYGLCEKERREWKCDFKTRLDSDNLYDLIKEDLTERDKEKIAINKRVFLGISE